MRFVSVSFLFLVDDFDLSVLRSLVNAQTDRYALRLARDSARRGTLSRSPAFTPIGLWSYYVWSSASRANAPQCNCDPNPMNRSSPRRMEPQGCERHGWVKPRSRMELFGESDIEGKAAMGSGERAGKRTSFKGAGASKSIRPVAD